MSIFVLMVFNNSCESPHHIVLLCGAMQHDNNKPINATTDKVAIEVDTTYRKPEFV